MDDDIETEPYPGYWSDVAAFETALLPRDPVDQVADIATLVAVHTAEQYVCVAAARREARGMEGRDRFGVCGLEGDMAAARQRRAARDEQLIRIEPLLAALDGNAEDAEHRFVEAPAGGDIRRDDLDMVDEPSAMKLHAVLPFRENRP